MYLCFSCFKKFDTLDNDLIHALHKGSLDMSNKTYYIVKCKACCPWNKLQ